jgi:gas vesicle protein
MIKESGIGPRVGMTLLGVGAGGVSGAYTGATLPVTGNKEKRINNFRTNVLTGAATGAVMGGAYGFYHGNKMHKNDLKWKKYHEDFKAQSDASNKAWEEELNKAREQTKKHREDFNKKYKYDNSWEEESNRARERTRQWRESSKSRRESAWDEFKRGGQYGSAKSTYENNSMGTIGKGFDGTLNSQTKKVDALKKYKEHALKHHPDKGGTLKDMQDINAVWDNFKKTKFEKLAYYIKRRYGI